MTSLYFQCKMAQWILFASIFCGVIRKKTAPAELQRSQSMGSGSTRYSLDLGHKYMTTVEALRLPTFRKPQSTLQEIPSLSSLSTPKTEVIEAPRSTLTTERLLQAQKIDFIKEFKLRHDKMSDAFQDKVLSRLSSPSMYKLYSGMKTRLIFRLLYKTRPWSKEVVEIADFVPHSRIKEISEFLGQLRLAYLAKSSLIERVIPTKTEIKFEVMKNQYVMDKLQQLPVSSKVRLEYSKDPKEIDTFFKEFTALVPAEGRFFELAYPREFSNKQL